MRAETCPLCRRRRARRTCPALARQICAVCCGTKRLTEIRCPSDCGYLVSARTHPPAVVHRQRERDARFLLPIVGGLNPTQHQLFFLVQGALQQLAATAATPLDDAVVRDAAQALAATYETAVKGIIYDHHPSSAAGERLARELKPLLERRDERGRAASERDLVAVLRCVERAATEARTALDGDHRAYLHLVGRLLRAAAGETGAAEGSATSPDAKSGEGPALIVP